MQPICIMKSLEDVVRENLRRIRDERDLSLGELSRRCGHHRTYLGKIERGKRSPSLRTVDELAEALEIDRLELLKDPEAS